MRIHRDQFGVGDQLATPDQLARRDRGLYDPRPSSGEFVARRVRLRCIRCGATLGHVDEYAHRILYHSVRENWWTRQPSGFKCRDCFAPLEEFKVNLDAIEAAVDRARHAGKVAQLKIGA